MFKSKIEKKAKEELKKYVDSWLEHIVTKGLQYDVYQSHVNKKKTGKEEEPLVHGVERGTTQKNLQN